MILQNDFQRQWGACGAAVLSAVERVGESGWYVLGPEVREFENALARTWGVAHAVGVANGMDAIEIALRSLGVGRGDKVLTTPLSAFATTLALMRVAARPVFVDVDGLGQIDLGQCRAALTADPSIRFMLPVHLFGFACELAALAQLQQDFDLTVVEDCAQAIGAADAGRAVGTVGRAAATSFYPTKNLGAMGDGGALLTNDDGLAERARALRNYGQSAQYEHRDLGLNSRLDELHAAILRDAFLPRLAEWTDHRRDVARRYLAKIDNRAVGLLRPRPEGDPVWHLFPVLVAADRRDAFRQHLKGEGVVTGIHYPRVIPDQDALRTYEAYDVVFPPDNARRLAACEVSLPVHPFLTDAEVETVVHACNRWQA